MHVCYYCFSVIYLLALGVMIIFPILYNLKIYNKIWEQRDVLIWATTDTISTTVKANPIYVGNHLPEDVGQNSISNIQ